MSRHYTRMGAYPFKKSSPLSAITSLHAICHEESTSCYFFAFNMTVIRKERRHKAVAFFFLTSCPNTAQVHWLQHCVKDVEGISIAQKMRG